MGDFNITFPVSNKADKKINKNIKYLNDSFNTWFTETHSSEYGAFIKPTILVCILYFVGQ